MYAKCIADKIGAVEYGWEPSAELCREAKEKGCIIVFGGSDDLCELRGLIDDEIGCFDGGSIHESCRELQDLGIELFADWCKSQAGWDWSYRTNKLFITFRILEEGSKYCEGIVIETMGDTKQ